MASCYNLQIIYHCFPSILFVFEIKLQKKFSTLYLKLIQSRKCLQKSNLNEIIFRVKRLNNQARSQRPCEILPSRPSVVSFHILIFSSETTEPNCIPVNPPHFRGSLLRKSLISHMDWVSCVGDINLPHTPFPPARPPPNKNIKYNKILTYILRSIFLEIPHLELPRWWKMLRETNGKGV